MKRSSSCAAVPLAGTLYLKIKFPIPRPENRYAARRFRVYDQDTTSKQSTCCRVADSCGAIDGHVSTVLEVQCINELKGTCLCFFWLRLTVGARYRDGRAVRSTPRMRKASARSPCRLIEALGGLGQGRIAAVLAGRADSVWRARARPLFSNLRKPKE